jgi:hypothetical protein
MDKLWLLVRVCTFLFGLVLGAKSVILVFSHLEERNVKGIIAFLVVALIGLGIAWVSLKSI